MTVQTEYEQNSKINEISLDSPRNFIKEICGVSYDFTSKKNSFLEEVSLEKKSEIKVGLENQKQLFKYSEIQVLQNKREEALKKPVI